MEIYNEIEIFDLCLHLKKHKTLILADLHLGYEESLNKRGVLVPRIQFNEIYDRLNRILSDLKLDTIVVTGDLKHEFGAISDSGWKNILKIIDLFLKHCKKLVIIKGNHDVTLPFITRKRNIELMEYFRVGDIFICHGDKTFDSEDFKESKVIIMGHEHPAVSLKDKIKYENFKCFLKGKYLEKILIVLPSFNPLTIGTDVLRGRLLSPFLQQDLSNFEAYIVEGEKVYNFGKLGNVS